MKATTKAGDRYKINRNQFSSNYQSLFPLSISGLIQPWHPKTYDTHYRQPKEIIKVPNPKHLIPIHYCRSSISIISFEIDTKKTTTTQQHAKEIRHPPRKIHYSFYYFVYLYIIIMGQKALIRFWIGKRHTQTVHKPRHTHDETSIKLNEYSSFPILLYWDYLLDQIILLFVIGIVWCYFLSFTETSIIKLFTERNWIFCSIIGKSLWDIIEDKDSPLKTISNNSAIQTFNIIVSIYFSLLATNLNKWAYKVRCDTYKISINSVSHGKRYRKWSENIVFGMQSKCNEMRFKINNRGWRNISYICLCLFRQRAELG